MLISVNQKDAIWFLSIWINSLKLTPRLDITCIDSEQFSEIETVYMEFFNLEYMYKISL